MKHASSYLTIVHKRPICCVFALHNVLPPKQRGMQSQIPVTMQPCTKNVTMTFSCRGELLQVVHAPPQKPNLVSVCNGTDPTFENPALKGPRTMNHSPLFPSAPPNVFTKTPHAFVKGTATVKVTGATILQRITPRSHGLFPQSRPVLSDNVPWLLRTFACETPSRCELPVREPKIETGCPFFSNRD
jgi:hypothetical protein